jgi:DNA-binding transcriptional ArsR family regulator
MTGRDDSDNPEFGRLVDRDEILQVMYWLRGERLAEDVDAGELSRWVGLEAAAIAPHLEHLTSSGLLRAVGDPAAGTPRYSLTEIGVREAGRRFADEFADMMRPGHFECSDPDCECRRTGDPADCVHRPV